LNELASMTDSAARRTSPSSVGSATIRIIVFIRRGRFTARAPALTIASIRRVAPYLRLVSSASRSSIDSSRWARWAEAAFLVADRCSSASNCRR
jgi:hypothetical protein